MLFAPSLSFEVAPFANDKPPFNFPAPPVNLLAPALNCDVAPFAADKPPFSLLDPSTNTLDFESKADNPTFNFSLPSFNWPIASPNLGVDCSTFLLSSFAPWLKPDVPLTKSLVPL